MANVTYLQNLFIFLVFTVYGCFHKPAPVAPFHTAEMCVCVHLFAPLFRFDVLLILFALNLFFCFICKTKRRKEKTSDNIDEKWRNTLEYNASEGGIAEAFYQISSVNDLYLGECVHFCTREIKMEKPLHSNRAANQFGICFSF